MTAARPNGKGTKLDALEWDFYQLPDDEAHRAFFYEYARSSNIVCDLVDNFRQEIKQHKRPSQPILEHGLFPLLFWLGRVRNFPKKPWQKLGHDTRLYSDLGNPSSFSLDGVQPIQFIGWDVFHDGVPKDKTKMILGRAGIEYRFNKTTIKVPPPRKYFCATRELEGF
jgi:hypothetical protein